jgi:hypothetical protein
MPLDLLNQNGVGWLKMFLKFGVIRSHLKPRSGQKFWTAKYVLILPLFVMQPQYPRNPCAFFRKKRSILAVDGAKTYSLAQRPT